MQEDVYQGDGLNLYVYCRNNPVLYYDPSGYSCKNSGEINCDGGNTEATTNKYQKASLWERITKRKASVNELHPNPSDEFSNPRIGPLDKAVSRNIREIIQTGKISDPIEVQKLTDGGYEIVNGHHRWLDAKKTGLKKVPIRIKNYSNKFT